MHRYLWFCIVVAIPLYLNAQEPPLVALTEAKSPEEEKKLFKLPPGFEAQLVASEPDIAKPMNLAFDAKGRLWVTSSLEYPFPAQGRVGRDMVHVLEDFAPDGKARKIHTFAKDLNIPMGVLPQKDGALVFSINSLDFFQGPVTSLYQSRKKLYGGFGFRDTHGMINSFTMGYDGWVYACHGYANDSATQGSDGQILKMNSGNVFRFKTDGSHAEIYTKGQVNPFGLCFDAMGNLYSADCHTKPMTQLIRGACYDSFGKPHDGLGYGPNMMGHLHDSTGLCGIIYYDADAYPKAYRDTMFVCNVVTCRINHDKLEFKGSTPVAVIQPDFMTSDDPWYRPVYMTIGPDGCIYIADFYNRIIGHYEVPLTHPGRDRTRGRIWRIVYKGDDAKATPAPEGGNLLERSAYTVLETFSHPNIAIRMQALNVAVERGKENASAFKRSGFKPRNSNEHAIYLWAQHRLRALEKDELHKALSEGDAKVQTHALRILAENADLSESELKLVVSKLKADSPFVQREAAETLGLQSHYHEEILQALLNARQAASKEDTHLIHTIRIALRNMLARIPQESIAGLSPPDTQQLRDITLGIASATGGKLALQCLQQASDWSNLLPPLAAHAARYASDHSTDIHKLGKRYGSQLPQCTAFLQAEIQGLREAGKPIPDEVRDDAQKFARSLCQHTEPGMVQLGIDLCTNARLTDQFDTLANVVQQAKLPAAQRSAAVNALSTLDTTKAESLLIAYITQTDLPAEVREKAASLAAGLNKPAVREQLFAALLVVPSRLANVIAYTLANTSPGADALLQVVEKGKVPPAILLTTSVQSRIINHNRQDFRERYAKLTQGLPPADIKLAELVAQRSSQFTTSKPNATRGAALFKQHCFNCHQLANEGAKVGPQLDGVGIRGVERLLEDILDPNRNVDQAFRATVVVLKDGRTLNGLKVREEGNIVVMVDAQGKEQKFDKNDVEESKITNLSPMPATFDTQLKPEELNDLLAYLLSQRVAK